MVSERVAESIKMAASIPRSDKEQELSHIMMVELLAHQFCFPVRWIETQDLLLDEARIEKFVEVGPADTLTTMIKRTRDLKHATHDIARSTPREFLSFNRNKDELYFEQMHLISKREEQAHNKSTPTPNDAASSIVASLPVPATAGPSPKSPLPTTVQEMPDCPVTALDILKCMIANGLKKDPKELSLESSIKRLSGGRSTVQNEIIGDLDTEFGTLPDGAEDLAILEVAAIVQKSFSAKLGRRSKSIVEKMISTKMPGSFGLSAVREHLKGCWGFGQGRQDTICLTAISLQPSTRFETEEQAKDFWANIARLYIKENKLQVTVSSENTKSGPSDQITLDPRALSSLQSEQRNFQRQIFRAYAKHLEVNLSGDDEEISRLRSEVSTLQGELDYWALEHGPEYAEGIKSICDGRKARVYNSAWNWAVQDLISLHGDLISGRVSFSSPELRERRQQLVNRSDKRMVEVTKFLAQTHRGGESMELLPNWLSNLATDCISALTKAPSCIRHHTSNAPRTIVEEDGTIIYTEIRRPDPTKLDSITMAHLEDSSIRISEYLGNGPGSSGDSSDTIRVESDCPLRIKTKEAGIWRDSSVLTQQYLDTLDAGSVRGLSFQGRNVLLTGAGRGSIGLEVLKGLLSGGAKVIVTTSSYSIKTTRFFQEIYSRYGSSDSQLTVLPFNQASQQDITLLVDHIYKDGNGSDIDHIIPFAAISVHTQGIDDINSQSELAHRLMLTNTLRLIGAVKRAKESRGIRTRPAQVILPLSPNHGIFGNDGLYAESKLGLEALLTKWQSEDWADYISICGTIIGWTRGTALMADNDLVSEGIEKLGVYTFSQIEMAFNIMGLMSSSVFQTSQIEPILADLSGGLNMVPFLKEEVSQIRKDLSDLSKIRRAQAVEADLATRAYHPRSTASLPTNLTRRAHLHQHYPTLPDFDKDIAPLSHLNGMVDLERVVVVAGFAEVGPFGNSRTRWEAEAHGEFSLEGCIELAWIMGLIEYRADGSPHLGWVDTATGQPVADLDVKSKYEEFILQHTGIRLNEPRPLDGDDPSAKQFLHEVELQEDLTPFEASHEVASDFQREHGKSVSLSSIAGSDRVLVTLKKGATLWIPKALKLDRTVSAPVPTGWNPSAYGISDDIISQVDVTTLYALVCSVEALLSAGLTDPYEFYKYIHVSELGTCVGSGLGGSGALQSLFKERFLDKPVAKDVLAESFINTGSAWINMLLFSSAGPINTPVGACATSIESLDVGCDLIMTNKAKVVLVGGYDSLGKDVAYEFANMKATNNTEIDLAAGREPKEMSRPATSTRSGFIESEGCGIQILTTAKIALEMGLPIHGIIALTKTASDKTGRSLPAPGRGILTAVSEAPCGRYDPPLLSLEYRKKCIAIRMKETDETEAAHLDYLQEELSSFVNQDVDFDIAAYRQHRLEGISADSKQLRSDIINTYGNEFWKKDDRISPLRGALATWGLTIDDLTVASFHGTSTKKNELNESEVIQTQLNQLGRSKGNPVIAVCQKALTGHPKGAAGAWMLNGCLQILDTGIVPGNRNADNIDPELRKFDQILFPNTNLRVAGGVKAFSVTSFGFGQKGAQAIGIHPKYLYAAIDKCDYLAYCTRVHARKQTADTYFQRSILTKSMFRAKDSAPYPSEHEVAFLTNFSERLHTG